MALRLYQALRRRWQQRWQRWWQARHPHADSHRMTQRNVYILPTRPGLFFCVTVGVLLLASINEQLSLGYLLSFLLAGAGLASMQSTHAVLRGLQLALAEPGAVCSGEQGKISIRLHNEARQPRFGLGLRALAEPVAGELAWTEVPAQGHASLQLRLPALPRGCHALPTLQVESSFPLGLFRAWSLWRPAARLWVYPRPESPCPPWPAGISRGQGAALNLPRDGQDEDLIRPYRAGDPPQRILWRKAAQGDGSADSLLVRQRSGAQRGELQLSWAATAGMGVEARLSRLAAWVEQAEQAQLPYALSLPGDLFDDTQPRQFSAALGAQHRESCLRALTLACTPELHP